MKFSRFAALFSKECRQIVRDPSSILIAFVLPIILIIIFTYAVSLDMNHLKIAMILEDDSAPARSLAGAFLANSHFESRVSADRRAFERDLVAGHIRGIVIIPRRFGEKLRQGEIKPLEVITDGSEPNTANFVQNYAQGVWAVWFGQHQALTGGTLTPTPDSETRIWYNPELESRHFLLPGALALIMTLIGTLLTALVISREWERGTMEALLSTAVTRGELLLGKLVPYFLLGMLSLTLSVAAIILVFHVPFRGSFLLLGASGAVFLFSALGLGLFISTVAKNQFVACQIAFLAAFMPSLMLSGFIFEISSMPAWIQYICNIIPAKYFITCLHSLFLVGNVPALLIPNMAYMAAVGALLLGLTFLLTRPNLE